jgi:hypothetical protein
MGTPTLNPGRSRPKSLSPSDGRDNFMISTDTWPAQQVTASLCRGKSLISSDNIGLISSLGLRLMLFTDPRKKYTRRFLCETIQERILPPQRELNTCWDGERILSSQFWLSFLSQSDWAS